MSVVAAIRARCGRMRTLGHGLSLLERGTLRGLRTRAVPAGVTARSEPGLVKLPVEEFFVPFLAKQSCYLQTLYGLRLPNYLVSSISDTD